MLHLRDVLQLVVDALDDGALAEQDLVGDAHQGVLHVVLHLGYQLNAVDEQPPEEVAADVALVTDKAAVDGLDEALVLERHAVVHVARRQHEVEYLASLVADQVQLEAVEPAHRTLAALRQTAEGLVRQYPLAAARLQRRAVNEGYACASAQQELLDEHRHRQPYGTLQLHEPVVRHSLREQVIALPADVLDVEVLQAAVAGAVEHYDYHHYLSLGHASVAVVAALAGGLHGATFNYSVKNLAEIVNNAENFSDFVIGQYHDIVCLSY